MLASREAIRSVSTTFLNVAKSFSTREVDSLRRKKIITDIGEMDLIMGRYHPYIKHASHAEPVPEEYFRSFYTKLFGELQPNTLFVICNPTIPSIDKQGRLLSGGIEDPGHIHGFGTDNTGEIVIESHADFDGVAFVSSKDSSIANLHHYTKPELYDAEFGESSQDIQPLIVNTQRRVSGRYSTNAHSAVREGKMLLQSLNKEFAILSIPGFTESDIAMTTKRIYASVENISHWRHEKKSILTGQKYTPTGGKDRRTGEVIYPFNCGIFFFEMMKKAIAHDKSRFKTIEEFKVQLFRAAPPVALALLVEQRFGQTIAEKLVNEMAVNSKFQSCLKFGTAYRKLFEKEASIDFDRA